jgi:transposase
MRRVKYTKDILATAVGESRSIADVLRHLGLRASGGSHAHIRRRINAYGIDTSHFCSPMKGRASPRRRDHLEVLVVRHGGQRRARPEVLRRALLESGVDYSCAECRLGPTWNGRDLTLHVDHVNGDFNDCRVGNLRFLCPNCHSQTPTYAGRNRKVRGTDYAPTDHSELIKWATAAGVAGNPRAILDLVERNSLTVADAARLIGCSRGHVYRLQQRLRVTGSLEPRRPQRFTRADPRHDAIIHMALAHPSLGPKKLAVALRHPAAGGWRVAHGTVSNVLADLGLNTRAKRLAAARMGR